MKDFSKEAEAVSSECSHPRIQLWIDDSVIVETVMNSYEV